MKLIFLGAPGAGKGTQAEILSEKLGIPAISTGNILRAAIQAGTQLGNLAKSLIDKGQLVPDNVILDIVAHRLSEPDCQGGYILDGVPRTLPQAEALEKMGVTVDAVVSLEVPDEAIVERMGGRRVCGKCGAPYHTRSNPPKVAGICDHCGGALVHREDDQPDTVRKRLAVYHAETEPLKQFYAARDLLKKVPGDLGSIEDVTTAICQALGI